MPQFRAFVDRAWNSYLTDAYEAQDHEDALVQGERIYKEQGSEASAKLHIVNIDDVKIKEV